MGMGGSASDPSLYDWGIEKLFGNQHVSRFSRMEPVIQIGDVYGGSLEKIKIATPRSRQSPAIGFVQFVQPFQVIRVFRPGRPIMRTGASICASERMAWAFWVLSCIGTATLPLGAAMSTVPKQKSNRARWRH